MINNQTYDKTPIPAPPREAVPERYRGDVEGMFRVWEGVRARNLSLSRYFDMKNGLKDLGISIPETLLKTNCVVGWCSKAVSARAVRSRFDGFVFGGAEDGSLNRLVRENGLRSLYRQAVTCALTHGLSAITVMRGGPGQPEAKVRVYSANQFACLWDKRADRVKCGMVLHDTDESGAASSYIAFFDDAVLTIAREGAAWRVEVEPNPMGRPLMEVLVNDPSPDRPLGHSLLTPELRGIVDKAMRDVLRMEIGSEFFTFPQRYIVGAADDLFAPAPDPRRPADADADGPAAPPVSSDAAKLKAYIGAYLAITRDENGDMPQVGQFSAAQAENFVAVFENDAQRFSGATNVPIGQLGVLSGTYTSSDALGAANDPLILDVMQMNDYLREPMAEVGRMMLAVAAGCRIEDLSEVQRSVEAYFADPTMPTISARADAWTKLGAADPSVVGTRVYYEGVGLSQQTIDRLASEKESAGAIETMRALASALGGDAARAVARDGR